MFKEVNNKKEITYYIREIRNLLVKNLIVDENKNVLGVNYLNHNFMFNDQSSLVYEVNSNKLTLVKLDEKFLNKNRCCSPPEQHLPKMESILICIILKMNKKLFH